MLFCEALDTTTIAINICLEDFINISNKSTKTYIQIQLYTIAKKQQTRVTYIQKVK